MEHAKRAKDPLESVTIRIPKSIKDLLEKKSLNISKLARKLFIKELLKQDITLKIKDEDYE